MKKKIANVVELLFLIISFVIMLIPCVTLAVTSPKGLIYETTMSAMDTISKYPIMKTPMLVLFLLCAVMCIVSIVSKRKYRDGRIHSILAIILFLYTNYCVIACGAGYGEIISTKFPTAIFEFCLFAVVVVSFVKRSTLIAGLPEIKIAENAPSNADELKKFKDLLDSGAITQEEFDEKKKQLLGL